MERGIDRERIRRQLLEARAKKQFDNRRAGVKTIRGKRVRGIPLRTVPTETIEDFEKNGAVVGSLETELAGDESPLQPGTYNIFVKGDQKGRWVGYAVDDEGNIKAQAARTEVVPYQGRARRTTIQESGYCVTLIVEVWLTWPVRIRTFYARVTVCW